MPKYDVVLVPFPFDDLSSSKVRPAVCLTDPIGPHQHIVLAFITSRVDSENLATDILINDSDDDFEKTGLRVSSTLRLHRVITVSATIIRRRMGALPPNLQAAIDIGLRVLLDLND
ncbi:MAG: type II toxin-antitoxin system PemK/MazF family toxin [Caldilineaceae bacterium]